MADMPSELAAAYLGELPRLCKAVKNATGCSGVNVLSNLGGSAGQMVFHTHFHVIPRFDNDELLKAPGPKNGMIDQAEATQILAELQKHV